MNLVKSGLDAVTAVVKTDPLRNWSSMTGQQKAQTIEDGSLCL